MIEILLSFKLPETYKRSVSDLPNTWSGATQRRRNFYEQIYI